MSESESDSKSPVHKVAKKQKVTKTKKKFQDKWTEEFAWVVKVDLGKAKFV